MPDERRAEQTRLEVRYSPTLAGAMVDALPYLVDYPYGCTEQTLNRFLPTVITQQHRCSDMKLDLKAIQEKRTNLNAQEIGDDQRAGRSSGSGTTATRSSTRPRSSDMVKAGVQAPDEHAARRRRLGLVLRLGEHSYAAHHRRRRPRPADRHGRTTWRSSPACSSAASSG